MGRGEWRGVAVAGWRWGAHSWCGAVAAAAAERTLLLTQQAEGAAAAAAQIAQLQKQLEEKLSVLSALVESAQVGRSGSSRVGAEVGWSGSSRVSTEVGRSGSSRVAVGSS